MADGKLVFIRPHDGTGHLVFGDASEATVPDASIGVDATFAGEADDMPATVQVLWESGVSRGEAQRTRVLWQAGDSVAHRASTHWQNAERTSNRAGARWQDGRAATARAAAHWQSSQPLNGRAGARWQDAQAQRSAAAARWQEAQRLRACAAVQWQDAEAQRAVLLARYQEAIRLRDVLSTTWQGAGSTGFMRHQLLHSSGAAVRTGLRVSTRWQDAMRPPAGLSVVTQPPVTPLDPCYDPATLGRLEFTEPWANNGKLVFICIRGDTEYPPETIVVPIRSVYMTINNFSLFRVDTGQLVPATGLSLSLDVDSWTWNCSFSVQGGALSTIERNSSGDPVILQASINGTPIRVIVEKISRERSFGSSQLRVQGRGIAAELDSPFAPILSFGNPLARTARQLLDEILMFNGVSIGWGFDTTAFVDWLVPAGVFSHTGTYISALNAVVGSIGGYVQPHNTDRKLNVLLRYPTPAWGWSTAIPDMVLPSSVTSQEGIEWLDKPEYNRVFVHGQEGGRVGRYTRLGTAGDVLAPPVVDPLITHVDAERQRGRAILSDTGRIANVTLRLPVLAETGIIKPGRLVEYTDGPVSRIGMSRSVSIDVNLPTIYQTIQVETHVD